MPTIQSHFVKVFRVRAAKKLNLTKSLFIRIILHFRAYEIPHIDTLVLDNVYIKGKSFKNDPPSPI